MFVTVSCSWKKAGSSKTSTLRRIRCRSSRNILVYSGQFLLEHFFFGQRWGQLIGLLQQPPRFRAIPGLGIELTKHRGINIVAVQELPDMGNIQDGVDGGTYTRSPGEDNAAIQLNYRDGLVFEEKVIQPQERIPVSRREIGRQTVFRGDGRFDMVNAKIVTRGALVKKTVAQRDEVLVPFAPVLVL